MGAFGPCVCDRRAAACRWLPPRALSGNEPVGLSLRVGVRAATDAAGRGVESSTGITNDGQASRRGGAGRRGERERARGRAHARRRCCGPGPGLARGGAGRRWRNGAPAAQHLLRHGRFPPAPARLHAACPRRRRTPGADPEGGRTRRRRGRAQTQRVVPPGRDAGAEPAGGLGCGGPRCGGAARPGGACAGIHHRRDAAYRDGGGRGAGPAQGAGRTGSRQRRDQGAEQARDRLRAGARARRGAGQRALRSCHDDAGLRAAQDADGEQGQARLCPRRRGGLRWPQGAGARSRSGHLGGRGACGDLPHLRGSVRGEPRCGAGPRRSRRRAPVSRRAPPDARGLAGLQDGLSRRATPPG